MQRSMPTTEKIVQCAERDNLMKRYQAALRAFTEVSERWAEILGTADSAARRRARTLRDEARIESDMAQAELEQHISGHGCHSLPS